MNGFSTKRTWGFDIEDYFSITVGCGNDGTSQDWENCQIGTWEIDYNDPQGLLTALDGTPYGDSFFDHLALTFKQSTEFVIFDFDFNLINASLASLGESGFDLNMPYNLRGGFDVSFLHGSGMSHVTFAGRDPQDNEVTVPAPTPLALFGAGLLALFAVRYKAKQA